MAEIPRGFEWPIWLRKMGIFGTLALLGWMSTACGGPVATLPSQLDCSLVNIISVSPETDELSEMRENNVVRLDVPDCPQVIDLGSFNRELENKLSTRIPDKLVIGRNVFPDPKVDLSEGVRYLPIRDLPREYEVVVIEDQALAVVPIVVEGLTAEGVSYQGESLLVLNDLVNSLNASLLRLEPTEDIGLIAGSAVDTEKEKKRMNVDAWLFALSATTVIVGGVLGAVYFGGNSEYRTVSKQHSGGGKKRQKQRPLGSNDEIPYYDNGESYSSMSDLDGRYKVGDQVLVAGSVDWSQVGHYRELAVLSASSINHVLSQVGFMDPEFERGLRDAVARAQALDQQYRDLCNNVGEIPVNLDHRAVELISRDLSDSYSFPPPTEESLVQLRAAQQIAREFKEVAEAVHAKSSAASSAGAKTLDHIAYIRGETEQFGASRQLFDDHEQTIKSDYAHLDRVHRSIPPDGVKDIE